MAELRQIAQKIRSKNAGPFWLTVDIFCGSAEAYKRVCAGLKTADVAALFGAEADAVKRFEIAALCVVKISLPRPQVQGARADRDIHGASWAALLAEMNIQ